MIVLVLIIFCIYMYDSTQYNSTHIYFYGTHHLVKKQQQQLINNKAKKKKKRFCLITKTAEVEVESLQNAEALHVQQLNEETSRKNTNICIRSFIFTLRCQFSGHSLHVHNCECIIKIFKCSNTN